MANIRREFGDDLTLKNGNLGINTTTAQERVDVVGVVKGTDLNVTGVTSLTAYEGFLRADNQIVEETNLEFGNGLKASLSGEIIVGTGVTVTIGAVGLGTTSVGVGTHTIQSNIDTTDVNLAGGSEIECLKVYNTFTPPSGGTNERPYKPKPGELYYNYDFKTIEFFDGYGWRQVDNTTRSGRGFFGGGNSPSKESVIDQVNISSLGNATRFGDMTTGMNQAAGTASETRGLLSGGYSQDSVRSDNIDYFTMASSGNAIDFGNLTDGRSHPGGCSSSTRSLIASGYPSPDYTNVIDYVEIATVGNAVDFGDVTLKRDELTGLSSPTRGIFAGGSNPTRQSIIEFVTIASKGDAIDFGELTRASGYPCGGGNGTRGIVVAGNTPSVTDFIDQITIASTGNAVDFGGTCALALAYRGGSACTKTRMVFGGGSTTQPSATHSNHIEYITINSSGNGIDFGDLSIARVSPGGLSDSHGGLGGF